MAARDAAVDVRICGIGGPVQALEATATNRTHSNRWGFVDPFVRAFTTPFVSPSLPNEHQPTVDLAIPQLVGPRRRG